MWAAVGAVLLFTVMNVFAKYLSENHSVIEISFYRNVVASLPFLVAIVFFGRREILIIQSKPGAVIGRAALGVVSLALMFFAFALMPMAETTVLLFTASLFIPVMGVVFLKEHVGPYRWLAVFAGFVGVGIMVNPSGVVNVLGVAAALSAAFLQALMSVLLRHLGGHERPETVTFYFFVVGAIITGMALPFVANPPTLDEAPLFLGIGISAAVAQWLYATALKNIPAAIVAVVNFSSIIWAVAFGWLIWNDWPLPIVFVGAAVIIGANALIVWRENRARSA